jgi:hypothetical protein
MKRDLEKIIAHAERVQVVDGPAAIEKFNSFLDGRYKWAVSGVDWTCGEHIERVHAHHDYASIFAGMIERHPSLFSGSFNVFFYDAQFDIVLSADREALLANVKIVEEWDDYLITEFWVFDEHTGALIEAYHEGYVTLSMPHDLSKLTKDAP